MARYKPEDSQERQEAKKAVAAYLQEYLRQENLRDALAKVDEILDYLKSGHLNGVSEPLLVYLICYQVLAAANDPRSQAV